MELQDVIGSLEQYSPTNPTFGLLLALQLQTVHSTLTDLRVSLMERLEKVITDTKTG